MLFKQLCEVTIPMTLKAWQIGVDPDIDNKSTSLNVMRKAEDRNNPMLVIHYAGSIESNGKPSTSDGVVPPRRQLIISLNICVLQGLFFISLAVNRSVW